MPPIPRRPLVHPQRLAVPLALAALLLIGACSSDSPSPEFATPTGAASILGDGYPRLHDELSGFSVILGTPDLGVGTHRVAFVLSDATALVRLPVLRIASYAPDDLETAAQEVTARFYAFPLGIRGIYVSELTFDRPGAWTLAVRIPSPRGAIDTMRVPLDVAARPAAPAVGDLAPASVSRTLASVDNVEDLSTGAEIDEALYALSIDEALANALPTMIVFASPGFCTNALCGPQVELMSELRAKYPAAANYIHVDLFENPVELRSGGLEQAIRSPLLEEWGLHTDEWTFLIDADGRITHRFEAFVPIEELEPALTSLIAR